MKNYKNSSNEVYAFESDEDMRKVCNAKGLEEMVPISEETKNYLLSPTQEQLYEQRIKEIDKMLSTIDRETERLVRSIKVAELKGVTPNQADVDRLISLEEKAEQLRVERRGFSNE